MSRANTIQTNFTAGELSPNMYGRVDIAKYFNGARKLRSMIVLPQGGARRCPGTQYLGAVHDNTKKVIVRTFTFSENDSYVLEFGHLTMRIWQTGALLGAPLVVTSPYGQNDLAELKIVQSADVLFIAHPDYYPRTLTRASAASWTFANYDNSDGPYMSTTPEADVTASSIVDAATATATVNLFASSGSTKAVSALTYVSYNGANRAKLTVTGHGWATGDQVQIAGFTSALVTPNQQNVVTLNGAWTIYVLDANTIYLVDSTWDDQTAYTVSAGVTGLKYVGGYVEFRKENTWKLARITSFSSATVAGVDVIDSMVVSSGTVKLTGETVLGTPVVIASAPFFSFTDVGKIIRTNTTDGNPGWYYLYAFTDSQKVTATKLTLVNFDDLSKAVTITSRTITAQLTSTSAVFVSTDVGRLIRLKYGSQWVPGQITTYTSNTLVSITMSREFPIDPGNPSKAYNGGAADSWKIGAWGSVQGYPSAVAFHQNRLAWASTTAEPTTKWLSKSGDYYNFETSDPETAIVSDDSAMTITLVSRQVNRVRWMDSGPVLLVGTEGAEWQIKPSSIQQSLTPTNVSATIQTAYGSANLEANRIGGQTIFVERSGLKIRELAYDFSIDAFASKDVSILSEHILRENGGVVEWAVQTNPYTIIWIVLGNGKVATVTYEKEHEVTAWSLHDFGGVVSSVTAVPNATGEDELYFVVARTINSIAVKFIERITGLLTATVNYNNCGKTNTSGSAGIGYSTGFNHLIGATVGVSLDGVYLGSQVVDGSGRVHVGYVGSRVDVGLLNEVVVGILDPEGGSQAGSSQAKKKRINESAARVQSSYYFKVASAGIETNVTENLSASSDPVSGDRTRITPAVTLGTQTAAGVAGTVVPSSTWALVSGDISFSVDDAFDTGARFEIVQDEPYPLHIMALAHELNTNE